MIVSFSYWPRRPRRLLRNLFALRDLGHTAARRTGEELPRPSDLVFGIGHHLVQLRDPPDSAGEREDRREELHRNADGLLHDARVEIDVRIQLALHEVIILERDLFEPHRELEQRIVAKPELAEHLVARLPHQ